MSYDFNATWKRTDLLCAIRYIERAPEVTTMGPSKCGCPGYTRGGGVCWRCLMDELMKRLGHDKDLLTDIKSLEQLESYDDKRKACQSHNIALMLALKKGTAGYCHPPASGRPTRT